MEVLPNSIVKGQAVRHFRLNTRTTPFIDLIYKVRSAIEAFTNLAMTRSLFYKKKHREASTHRDVVVTFDWQNRKADYVSFGKLEQSTVIFPGTFDPLGIVYYARTQNLDAADEHINIGGKPGQDKLKFVVLETASGKNKRKTGVGDRIRHATSVDI